LLSEAYVGCAECCAKTAGLNHKFSARF